ncbi:selenoneine biosynthesis selenosugar synthase SenB [Massilia cavernae]|uniref:TIGR04348 family glycosyltransferase n=1 Tax=Massilia cavernae TaxID=2320864 RepID=A0A418XUL7_9BURK|nr:selenoneine biosynthesis selenosugar synthase SenB [Massilia cavernae]RJG16335.1 TIGR04348 family glycosyltransferase [Massilia cavernae]
MKRVAIVSPALAGQNNGNWQTASRWAHFLKGRYQVDIATSFTPGSGAAPDLMIALHARRSAAALAAFARAFPQRPRVLVLTGTDLYRDIRDDASAQASLAHASVLVVLQDAGLDMLPAAVRQKARVIRQSAPAVASSPSEDGSFTFTMIGHLRPEKDPLTFMRACPMVTEAAARFVHIGGALDPELGMAAERTQALDARYRWLGNLPHQDARGQLARSHAMVIASVIEGGANVIIEAVTSGVPVLASDISGNRGMLGDDYAGYFPVGDAAALAALIGRSIADPAFLARLRAQCAARAALFTPAAEQAAVLDMVDNLLVGSTNFSLESS